MCNKDNRETNVFSTFITTDDFNLTAIGVAIGYDNRFELFITKLEINRFVSSFIFSMQDANIPFTARNKLLNKLASLRGEVIEL